MGAVSPLLLLLLFLGNTKVPRHDGSAREVIGVWHGRLEGGIPPPPAAPSVFLCGVTDTHTHQQGSSESVNSGGRKCYRLYGTTVDSEKNKTKK